GPIFRGTQQVASGTAVAAMPEVQPPRAIPMTNSAAAPATPVSRLKPVDSVRTSAQENKAQEQRFANTGVLGGRILQLMQPSEPSPLTSLPASTTFRMSDVEVTLEGTLPVNNPILF